MHNPNPDFSDLFDQLGLPSSPADIHQFMHRHAPLPNHLHLNEAPFWSPAQASFLQEQIRLDAEWALVVDALNVQLRDTPQYKH